MKKSIKDRLITIRFKKDEKFTAKGFFITGVIATLLIVNLIYLNLKSFKNNNLMVKNSNSSQSVTTSSTTSPTQDTTKEALITSTTAVSLSTDNQTPVVKDYFIPLGSGTAQSDDWQDVVGALVVTNLGQYPSIKEIHFEASVNVPTGNEIVWVRLFNKTDQHPVWYSEVVTASNNNSYLISPSIAYDFGEKTYQVQMKTQLKDVANLAQARIHVKLK